MAVITATSTKASTFTDSCESFRSGQPISGNCASQRKFKSLTGEPPHQQRHVRRRDGQKPERQRAPRQSSQFQSEDQACPPSCRAESDHQPQQHDREKQKRQIAHRDQPEGVQRWQQEWAWLEVKSRQRSRMQEEVEAKHSEPTQERNRAEMPE